MQSFVYILSNKKDGVLYIGVTSNLSNRIYEHKNSIKSGFASKYNATNLVYYEVFDDIENAIKREKRLKKYKRDQKITLIETTNLGWKDLYPEITL